MFLFPETDVIHLVNMFEKNPVNICSNEITAARNATAYNNLIYGFVDNHICTAFVSFQPLNSDNRIWTNEEKEILTRLALALNPLITKRQVFDRNAYEKNLKNSSSNIFWYYPKLSLMIIPESTMERLIINNFVYREAPKSFVTEFVKENFQDEVTSQLLSLNKDNPSINLSFKGAHDIDSFYKLSATVNRYDDKDNPEEVMCMIENISENTFNFENSSLDFKKYQLFREIMSRSNLLEFHVNLTNGKITLFKANNLLKKYFNEDFNFDQLINTISNELIDIKDQEAFKKVLNRSYLQTNLNKDHNYITLSNRSTIDNKSYILETTILLYNKSIYNYCQEVMIFVRNITHLKSLNYDNLTGLYSINYFNNYLINNKDYILENDNYLKNIIFFNFKDFKYYNLTIGYEKGDLVIQEFAAKLNYYYPSSLVARVNDDKFILLNTIATSIDEEIKNINQIFESLNKTEDTRNLKLKVGIYTINKNDDDKNWIEYAKLACQFIKSDINQNIKIYDEELRYIITKKEYIINSIDNAIANNWIKVYFQPVVDTKTNKLIAMEALTRWVDPVYGFLSPLDFIPVLEQNNLIYKLDTFVVKKVCSILRNEIDQNHKIVQISINLSRRDFISSKPFEQIENILKEYNIDRKYICIEITESVAMDDPKLLTYAINKFRDTGYEVWMDDFGSGYSSLNALKDYSFDEIKIDMAFLKTTTEKSKSIIKHTISMAKDLNIRTLTEGVETKEQYDFLKSIGCERIQGYYISKPLPYDEVIELMRKKDYFK